MADMNIHSDYKSYLHVWPGKHNNAENIAQDPNDKDGAGNNGVGNKINFFQFFRIFHQKITFIHQQITHCCIQRLLLISFGLFAFWKEFT